MGWVVVLLQGPVTNALSRADPPPLWQQGRGRRYCILSTGDVHGFVPFLVGVGSLVFAGTSHHVADGGSPSDAGVNVDTVGVIREIGPRLMFTLHSPLHRGN